MKLLLVFMLIIGTSAFSQAKVESFIIKLDDRRMKVFSPMKRKVLYPVRIENHSLSDQLGKFMVEGQLLKYVAIKPGESETIEIENKSSSNVYFVPVSPGLQEVELNFGKKAYEIPSKE